MGNGLEGGGWEFLQKRTILQNKNLFLLDMKKITQTKHFEKHSLTYQNSTTSVSTMLISERLSHELNEFVEQNGGSFKELFRSLLDEFGEMILSYQPTSSTRLKKEYQASGQAQIKRNIRVSDSDLEEFRIIADYLRMSKCKLFAMLLEWKLIGWGLVLRRVGVVRVPTHHLTHFLSILAKPSFFSQKSKIYLRS
ncbi:DUF1564 family protein [Leptospira idonii]|uniref:DUF1564 family protein n=1 Tax=Leptospira idonii TaxID=1193500 RepID=A0A4R9M591_9LEPT|nr:DUF1564 family protein [Leptospira idonii]TGN21121.1 DUF1564 family protein [Leptospira idonii]